MKKVVFAYAKIVSSLILLCISVSSYSQQTIFKNYESQYLQDVRNIKISIPKGYHKDKTLKYPLTLILDDNYLLNLYVSNANIFGKANVAPKQIVIGINMEKTFKKDISFIKSNGALTKNSELFYFFLKEELIPYIENNYRTSPFLTIVSEGKSVNFTMQFLKEIEPIFNAYVCLNPTFSTNISKQIESYSLARYGEIDNSFYFYTNSCSFFSKEQKIIYDNLKYELEGVNLKNFSVKFDDLKETPHRISTITLGVPKALYQTFEAYSDISKEEFDSKIKDLSPLDAIMYLENKYLDIEYLFGTNIGIRKNDIIALEGLIMDKENGDYLKLFGEMIQKLSPKWPLGDYYIGKFYEDRKNYKKALYYYKVAYGKMSPSDPNLDLFYKNIERVAGL